MMLCRYIWRACCVLGRRSTARHSPVIIFFTLFYSLYSSLTNDRILLRAECTNRPRLWHPELCKGPFGAEIFGQQPPHEREARLLVPLSFVHRCLTRSIRAAGGALDRCSCCRGRRRTRRNWRWAKRTSRSTAARCRASAARRRRSASALSRRRRWTASPGKRRARSASSACSDESAPAPGLRAWYRKLKLCALFCQSILICPF